MYLVLAIITENGRNAVAGKLGLNKYSGIRDSVNLLWTFMLVVFAWIFFRSNNLNDAMLIISNIFDFSTYNTDIQLFHFSIDFYLSFILIGVLILIEIAQEKYNLIKKLQFSKRWVKWGLLILLVLSIFILGKWDETDFLYFQF